MTPFDSHAAMPMELDVAIIGGGAAGVLVAIHLLRASEGRARAGDRAAGAARRGRGLFHPRVGAPAQRAGPRYVPRLEYGHYLRATLAEHAAGDLLHVRDDAVDLSGSGPYAIRLGSGRTLHAGAVVLAMGNFPRSLAATGPSAATIDHAWDYEAIAAMPPQARRLHHRRRLEHGRRRGQPCRPPPPGTDPGAVAPRPDAAGARRQSRPGGGG